MEKAKSSGDVLNIPGVVTGQWVMGWGDGESTGRVGAERDWVMYGGVREG